MSNDFFRDQDYFKDSFNKLKGDISSDSYKPGSKNRNSYPDEIAEAIETLMYIQDFKSVSITISKEPNKDTLVFEITDRVK
jgi:hypothetical protein